METLNKVKRAITNIEFATYLFAGAMGELLQLLVEDKVCDYNWGVGHISDIAASGIFTNLLLNHTGIENKLLGALAVPTFLSILELIPLINHNCATVYDSQDILCYYGAALASYMIHKVTEERFPRKGLEKKLN